MIATGWKLLAHYAAGAAMMLFVLMRGEFTAAVKSIQAFPADHHALRGRELRLGNRAAEQLTRPEPPRSRTFHYGGVVPAIVFLRGIVYYLRCGARTPRFETSRAAIDPAAR